MSNIKKKSKAGKASGAVRSARARPRNKGVKDAYAFLRTGKPVEGYQFLIEEGKTHIAASIELQCDHATAVSIIADRTGYTKRRVRQILSRPRGK